MANKKRLIKIEDEERSLTEWIALYADRGITRQLVLGRLERPHIWTEEAALTTPPGKYRDNQRRINTAKD